MRAELLGPEEQVTLVSPDELIEFHTEAEARFFLDRFLGERHNVDTLRRVLGESCGVLYVQRMQDHEVLDEVARRLVRACVGMVRLEMPPTTPLGDTEGVFDPSEFENAPTPLSEDEEPEFEETKPEPVIPPEYPRLAREEGSALDRETSIYKILLTLLSYVGHGGSEDSEVGKQLKSTAKSAGGAVVDATSTPSTVLVKLASGGMPPKAESQVRDEMTALAKDQGKSMTDTADKLGDTLGTLAEAAKIEEKKSDVGSTFQKESERQRTRLIDTAQSFGETLWKVEAPEEPEEDEEPGEGEAVFKVVDDATGEPLGMVKVVVKLPGGEEKRLVTGKNGEVKLRGELGEDFEVVGLISHETLEVVAMDETELGGGD